MKYEGNMKKYEGKMKEYYEEICSPVHGPWDQ